MDDAAQEVTRVPNRQIRVLPLQTALGPGGLAESVARQISGAIHLGMVAPGERLPSEGVLAGHLGVSIMTLREALAILREQGLVETRRGRNGGSFACPPGSPSVASLRDRLRGMSATELRDIGDEHVAVSGTSALLAAKRAALANIVRLGGLADELEAARSIGARSRACGKFWIELALATQSERLTQASVALQSTLGALAWLPRPTGLDQVEAAAALRTIVERVEAEAPEPARTAAEDFVDRTTRCLIAAHLDLTRRRA